MSLSDQSVNRGGSTDDRLGPLIDEFVERFRCGERPSLTEYVSRCPDLESEIRELFPALVAMEQAGPDVEVGGPVSCGDVLPERLGEYRIVREIGRGGMGIVYEAVQESLDRTVALKVLPGLAALDRQQRLRFQREARTAAMLHHTSIVPVFAVGEHDGVLFYAMQYIAGRPLDEVLEELRRMQAADAPLREAGDLLRTAVLREGPDDDQLKTEELVPASAGLPARPGDIHDGHSETKSFSMEDFGGESAGGAGLSSSVAGLSDSSTQDSAYYRNVALIGCQAAEALDYAHGCGVLHRDIKPSNLLLDLNGSVWVADFGLARTSDDGITQTGDLIGTLRYMAPERFQGACSAAGDVYSLGLTLYELLTLQPAYAETDRARLIQQVTRVTPPRPRSVNRRIPRDLETVVSKAIEKEPSARYRSAREMADDLRRFLGDRPIVARRTPYLERFGLWVRRNPVVAALLSLVMVLTVTLAVGSTIAVFQLRSEQSHTLVNLGRARQAEEEARQSEKLAVQQNFESLLSRARAVRQSRRAGRRTEGLEAVRQAAMLARQLDLTDRERFELRNEAIGCLSLVDLEVTAQWAPADPGPRYLHWCWACDSVQNRFACDLPSGEISIRRLTDFSEVQRLPGIAPFVHELAWKRPLMQFSRDGRWLAAYGFVLNAAGQNLFALQVWDVAKARLVMKHLCGGSQRGRSRGGFAFGPDSRFLYYMPHYDRLLRRVRLEDGREDELFEVSLGASFLAVHPEGKVIACSQQHGTIDDPAAVVCLDLRSGEQIRQFDHPGAIGFVGWSRDGRHLLTSAGRQLAYVWDRQCPERPSAVLRGHESRVVHIDESEDGNLLVTSSLDGTSRLWTISGRELLRDEPGARQIDASDGSVIYLDAGRGVHRSRLLGNRACRILGLPADLYPDRSILTLACSPDSRLLAAAANRSLCLWNLQTGHLLAEVELAGCRSVMFHPEGHVLAVTSNEGLRLLSVERLSRNEVLESDAEWVTAASAEAGAVSDFGFSADGQTAFAVRRFQGLDILSARAQPRLRRVSAQNYVSFGAISADGRWVACSAPFNSLQVQQTAGVIVFAAESGEIVAELPIAEGAAGRLTFSPDGHWLATVELEQVRLWRTSDWSEDAVLRRSELGAGMVSFSPDGRLVAVADRRYVKLFDTVSLKEVARLISPLETSLNSVVQVAGGCGLAFTPDSRRVAARSEDDSILVWDLEAIRPKLRTLSLDW